MGYMCCKSHSLYNAKECDDCGKCGRKGEVVKVRSLHKFDCSLTSVKPEAKEWYDRIWSKNDNR